MLYVRSPKGAELTEAGLTLLDEVPNLLAFPEVVAQFRGEVGQRRG
ncbi:MAG: hypothetical protein R3E48_09410 [Burkholderiaceae bacterium]